MSHKSTPRVFVTQEVRNPRQNIDYSPARKFGDVVFLTMMDFSSDEGSISNKALIEEIRTRLRDFNPQTDFVVTTGSPVVAAVVFMILRERTSMVKFLRWSNRDYCYQEVTIAL
jgi:hypothetical protein